MRSRVPTNETTIPARAPSLYDRDFALWIEAQVAAVRAGDLAALDADNLVEELEGLTKRDERALGSQLKRIMAHMLKQRYQPQRASRSWVDSIENGREEIADILEQSPSLRRTLPGLMTKNYPRAVSQAARDTRLPPARFPSEPPFALDEVLGDDERTRVTEPPVGP
jgi:hypothetical protein